MLVYLTLYSPDLNDIEGLWKKVKKYKNQEWIQGKSLEQKIRNVMNGIGNQKSLVKNILF